MPRLLDPKKTDGEGDPGTDDEGDRAINVIDKKKKKKKQTIEVLLPIFDKSENRDDMPGMTFVQIEEEVISAFAKIRRYLKPKMEQSNYEIFVSFGGYNMSREGFLSLIAITTGEGFTWIFDVITLENLLWDNGMREFLEVSYNEKVCYNVRGVRDLLYNVHNINLKGLFDLRIIEVYERGKVKAYKALPRVQLTKNGRSVIQKDLLFTIPEIFLYYFKDIGDMNRITTEIGEKTWRSRREGVAMETKRWMFEYQKFMISIWRNYDFSNEKKKHYWWISSELYTSMFAEKSVRAFNEFEENDYVPPYILCYASTDQPLGGILCQKCLRMLPTEQFTNEMLLNRPTCQCTLCLKVAVGGVETVKAAPTKKKKKK